MREEPLANKLYRRWYRRSFGGVRERLAEIEKGYQDACREAIAAEQKRRQPRRKHPDMLPKDDEAALIEPIKAHWLALGAPAHATLTRGQARRKAVLAEQGDQVEIISGPEAPLEWVAGDCSDNYRSVGLGAAGYARDALRPYEDALTRALVRHEVRSKEIRPSHEYLCIYTHRMTSTQPAVAYDLWAAIPLWMAEALFARITVEEALTALPRTCNAKVLMPHLDHARFERHMMGGYQRKGDA